MTAGDLPAIASGLALWPGLFLVLGGVGKALELPRSGVPDTIVARLLPWGPRPARRALWVIAAAELGAGALVLAGVLVPWPAVAAALLLAGATVVAAWGVRNAPDADCGCFGRLAAARVGRRTAARAGLLAVLAALAAVGGEGWTAVFGDAAALAVVAAAGVALAWLSPERPVAAGALRDLTLGGAGLAALRLRRLRDAACARRPVPLDRSVARLRRSELWRRARPYLSAEAPAEHWEDGCWRLICFPADYEGVRATAVFRVSLGRRQSLNAVAFVDESARRVLDRFEA